MTEYRLQESTHPSTYEYHQHRERVPHLEQSWHNGRLYAAAKMVRKLKPKDVVDLGCGDGGLLSVMLAQGLRCWGYDFQPSNAEGWEQRQVEGYQADIFNDISFQPKWGECVVVTEVLEHLSHPHEVVKWIAESAKYIVASSPKDEVPSDHLSCDSHIWSWDWQGYEDLLSPHFVIVEHKAADWSQVISGKSKYR